MTYIDKEKIDFKLPCYFEDSGDALVSIRDVKRIINSTPIENVAPVEELVNKIRASIRENMFNPYNKFDFIYDEIFDILDRVLEEYNGKKDS